MGLRKKLIIAMLAASVFATVAMGIASQFGFRRGFVDYLNDQGAQQMDTLVPRVTSLFERTGSWDYLLAHPADWFAIVGVPGGGPTYVPQNRIFNPSPIDVTGTGLRVALLDAAQRFIIGYPVLAPGSYRRPVVSGGATVGWLVLHPVDATANRAEDRFKRGQLVMTWIIGIFAIVAAAAVAVLLSNAFIKPIRSIGQTTDRLAAGDYAARVQATSRDEIGQLASNVNHLALAHERTEGMRRSFMADISHELRTPIAVLHAELESLYDGVRKPTPERLSSLLSEVKALGKLVDDVHQLAITDIGALTYRKEPVNLCAVLDSCVEAFRGRFEHQSLELSLQHPPQPVTVMADEGRLMQLCNNLLENALRYTDPGGQVQCHCEITQGGTSVVVEDSAPSVSEDLLPHLFERFFRVDSSRNRRTGGSGLGLAICRSIVEAHGGTITASHSSLGGVRVNILLPLAERAI